MFADYTVMKKTHKIKHHTSKELVGRLECIIGLKPKKILVVNLDVEAFELLQKKFPSAVLYKVDTIKEIAKLISNKKVDVIIYNLSDFKIDAEMLINRLKANGVLLFAVFVGENYDKKKQVQNQIKDLEMHDLGDLLLRIGLINPVVDQEYVYNRCVVYGYGRGRLKNSVPTFVESYF